MACKAPHDPPCFHSFSSVVYFTSRALSLSIAPRSYPAVPRAISPSPRHPGIPGTPARSASDSSCRHAPRRTARHTPACARATAQAGLGHRPCLRLASRVAQQPTVPPRQARLSPSPPPISGPDSRARRRRRGEHRAYEPLPLRLRQPRSAPVCRARRRPATRGGRGRRPGASQARPGLRRGGRRGC